MVSIHLLPRTRSGAVRALTLGLACIPALALGGCGSSDDRVAALEQRVSAAEAQAQAADQRARKAEQLAMQAPAAPQPVAEANDANGQTSPDLDINNGSNADMSPDNPAPDFAADSPAG